MSFDATQRLAHLQREAHLLRTKAQTLPVRFAIGASGGGLPPVDSLYDVLTRIAPIGQTVENGPWQSQSPYAQLDAYPAITPSYHWNALWTEDPDEGAGHGLPIGDASFWLMLHQAIIERDQQRRELYPQHLLDANAEVSLRITAESIAGTRIETLVGELLSALAVLLRAPFSHVTTSGPPFFTPRYIYAPDHHWHVRADNHGRRLGYDFFRTTPDANSIGDNDDLTLSLNKATLAIPGQPGGIRRKTWREHNPPPLDLGGRLPGRRWRQDDTDRINKLNQDFPPADGALSRDLVTGKVMQWSAGLQQWIAPTVPAPHIPDLIDLPTSWNLASGAFSPFPGYPPRGDVIGPWIFEDVRTIVNQCRYLRDNRVQCWYISVGYGGTGSHLNDPQTYEEMAANYGVIWSEPQQFPDFQSPPFGLPSAARYTVSRHGGGFYSYQGFSALFEVFVGTASFTSLTPDGEGPFVQQRTFDPPMTRAAAARLHFAAQWTASQAGDGAIYYDRFDPQGTSLLAPNPSFNTNLEPPPPLSLELFLTSIVTSSPSQVRPRFTYGDTSIPPNAAPSVPAGGQGGSESLGYDLGARGRGTQTFSRQDADRMLLIYDFAVEGGFVYRPAG